MNGMKLFLKYCLIVFCILTFGFLAKAQNADRILLRVCDNRLPLMVGDSALYVAGDYDIRISPDSIAHIRLTVDQAPVFEISTIQSSPSGCPGFYVFLSVDYNQYWDYRWNDGNNLDFRRIYPSETAYYVVTVTDRRNNCSEKDSILLTVYPTYEVYDTLNFCRNDLPKQYGDLLISEAGDYTAHFSSRHSCDSIVHAHINIVENPVPVMMGDVSHCSNASAFVYVNPIYSRYQWNNGATNYYASISGDYAWVQVFDNNGCMGMSDVRTFTVLPAPNITISGDTNVCFKDTSCIIAQGAIRYQWTDRYGVLMSMSDTFSFSPLNNASYAEMFRLMGFADNNCYQRIDFTIQAHPAYEKVFYDTCCRGDLPYLFHGFELPGAGVYDIHLQSQYGCDSLVHVHLYVIESPYAQIVTLNDSICPGNTTYLMATGNGTYRWNTGATTQNLMVSDTGNYVLEVTATNGCQSYDTMHIAFYPIPVVNIVGDSSVCLGNQLTLVAEGAYSYYWNTGTQTDTLRVSPILPTTYSVVGTSLDGCTASASHSVSIKETPQAQITGESSFCRGEFTFLTASEGEHYLWSTGEETQIIQVSEAQTYSVVITAANGCSSTASKTVQVKENPTLMIVGDTSFCEGGRTTLTATSDIAVQYLWDGTVLSSSIMVSEPGTHTVTAWSINNCHSTDSVRVVKYDLPQIVISGSPVFCAGSTSTLKASGGVRYSWSNAFGTEISTSDSLVLSESGQYTVKVYNEYQCYASQTIISEKKALPTAAISTWDDTEGCEGQLHATLTAMNGPNYQYLWSTGETTRSITVSTDNTFYVYVTANGCTSSDSIRIIVHPRPVITFSGNSDICIGDTAHITAHADNALAYLWTTLEASNHIAVAPTTNTIYTVTVTDIYHCVNINSIQVSVFPIPTASIIGLDSLCSGDSLLLQAQGGHYYLWNDGDTSALKYVYSPGLYSVQAFSPGGCYATANKRIYGYEASDVAITGQRMICQGDTTTLTAHGGVSYLWSNSSTDSSITVSEPGFYMVYAWNAQGCRASDTATVSFYAMPEVHIEGDSLVCYGDSTLLTARASSAGLFLWNTLAVDSAIWVKEAGIYSVLFTDEHQCHANDNFVFLNLPAPECTVVGDTSVCQGDTTTLTAIDGLNHYWSTGDTSATITVAPDTTSIYTLYFTDSLGCRGEKQVQVRVRQPFPLVITGNTDFCAGDSTLLVASGAEPLLWSTGVVGDSLWVKESGDYSVSALDEHTCASAATITVVKHQLPQVSIEGPLVICSGDTAVLRAVCNENATFLWSNQSTDSVIRVTTMGVYSVVATSDYGCENRTMRLLTVYSRPTLTISQPQRICRNDTVTLRAISNTANRYVWTTGDSTAEISFVATESEYYGVQVFNAQGCSNTASVQTNVLDLPVAVIEGNSNICQGETTTLTCSPGYSYRWSTGENTQSIAVSQAGNYSVVVSNQQGCSNSANVVVSVHQYPNARIQGDSLLCEGESTVLFATGGTSYLWNNGSTNQVISVTPVADTMCSVLVSNTYCAASASIMIRLFDKPQVSILGPDQFCEGDTVSLQAQGASLYLWNNGETTETLNITTGGHYQLIGFSDMGCADTVSKNITLLSNPTMVVSGCDAICEGSFANLYASGNGTFVWNTGDSTAAISISSSGVYEVLRINENGCTASVSHTVAALQMPVVTIYGVDSHCYGDTTILMADCQNAVSFQWNTGSTESMIAVNPPFNTNYSVTAISVDNCTTIQNHELAVHFPSSMSLSDNVCQGQPYDEHGFHIPAQEVSGTFVFVDTIQTVFGCDSIRRLTLTVDPLPGTPSTIYGNSMILSFGNYVYQIAAVSGAESYEWIISNPNWSIEYNQTVAQLSVNTPGSGTLSVYTLNHCGISQPQTLQITCSTGIEGFDVSTVTVYPNPTDNVVNVKMEEQQFDQLLLYDIYGRLLSTQMIEGTTTSVDLTEYASGIYLLKLKNTRDQYETSVKVMRK